MVSILNKLKKELVQSQNLMFYTCLSTVSQLAGFAVPMVAAKFFSKDIYGSYILARTIYFFAIAATVISVQTPFIVHASKERSNSGKINKSFSAQCIFFAFSLLSFFVVVALFPSQLASFAKISTVDLFFVSLAFAGFALRTFFCNIFLALGRRKTASLVGTSYNLFGVAFIILFYKFGGLSLANVFLVHLLSAVLIVLIFIWALDFKLLLPFDFKLERIKKTLKFATWIALGSISTYFINYGDNFILNFFVPLELIGVYGLSYQIFKGFSFLMSALNSYFLPFISEHAENKEKLRNYLFVKRPKIVAAGIVILVCFYFLFPYALRFIYGQKFIQSENTLRILLIGNAIQLYTIFYIPLYDALKRYKFNNISAVIQVAVKLVLGFILIPIMGILGAAIATVISFFLRAVLMEVYFWLKVRRLLD